MKARSRWIARIIMMAVATPGHAAAATHADDAACGPAVDDKEREHRKDGEDGRRIGVGVSIDVTLVDLTPDVLVKRLTFEVTKRIGEANMDERDDGRAQIHIEVRPGSHKNAGFDYNVKGYLDEAPVIVPESTGLCVPCSHQELVRRLDPILVLQLAALQEAASAPRQDSASAPAPVPPPVSRRDPAQDNAQKLTGLGYGGIGLLVAGGLGVVAGGLLVGMSPSEERYGDDSSRGRRFDARVGGGVALGIGAVAMVIGATMLGINATRHRRKRSGGTARGDVHGAAWRVGAGGWAVSF